MPVDSRTNCSSWREWRLAMVSTTWSSPQRPSGYRSDECSIFYYQQLIMSSLKSITARGTKWLFSVKLFMHDTCHFGEMGNRQHQLFFYCSKYLFQFCFVFSSHFSLWLHYLRLIGCLMQGHGIPCKIASVSKETSKAMGYVQGIHWYDCTLHYLKWTSHWRVR